MSGESSDFYYYSENSKILTKQIKKSDKKDNGIYFTNPNTVFKILSYLKLYTQDSENTQARVRTILEPSCGSGEFLTLLKQEYPCNVKITGIELNETIFNSIKHLDNGDTRIINTDFLQYNSDKGYDLIIGNPPFYVIKKQTVNNLYYDYFTGRPNIFIIFIIKSLQLLNDNGILSFILPKNFLNCLYYDKTRKHINDNFKILNIVECCENFIETKQKTIILFVKNELGNNYENKKFIMNSKGYTIFGAPENIKLLNELYKGASSLKSLNFEVKVGNIVWNDCKDELTNDKTATRLIYSSDVSSNSLTNKLFKNQNKKKYIKRKGFSEPVLVINRGYGVGDYNFEYCIIDGSFDYLIENHLIYIYYTENSDSKVCISLYKKIMTSFKDARTKKFINLYFGNNAINVKELQNVLPIYNDILNLK